MLSKVYGECTMARFKIYEWHRRLKEDRESIEDNEHVGLLSTSRNVANIALVSGFEKIVTKHLHKSLCVYTFRRCRLWESIRRTRLQFWQIDDWYLLHDNAAAHRSQLVKEFLA
ncbi:hypothetical protein TNCV_1743721 [Trichonephila clavipes]|nr:hypothetical protein TNCV_1743721 [Trichonephila clavipes]